MGPRTEGPKEAQDKTHVGCIVGISYSPKFIIKTHIVSKSVPNQEIERPHKPNIIT